MERGITVASFELINLKPETKDRHEAGVKDKQVNELYKKHVGADPCVCPHKVIRKTEKKATGMRQQEKREERKNDEKKRG